MVSLTRYIKTSSQRKIKKILPLVGQINEFYDSIQSKSDQELIDRTEQLKQYVQDARNQTKNNLDKDADRAIRKKIILEAEQQSLDNVMVEAFAMVKETCRRMIGQSWRVSGQNTEWNMVPYDVQLLGAIVLHKGKVSEMKPGEGQPCQSILMLSRVEESM